MSTSPINTNNAVIGATQFSNISSLSRNSQGSADGNNDRSVSGVGKGGGFASAISQALSQLGGSGATSNSSDGTDPSSSTDSQQALASFMQNLFAALQGQSGNQGTSPSDAATTSNSGSSVVTGTAGGGHHHHHAGGMGKLETGLQNLAQQLTSNAGQGASDASNPGSNSSNTAIDALQTSFNNLLSADGVSGSSATLSGFLQSLSQNLQGAPANGNVVSTQA